MEEWKDIKGYEGLYQVSNLGNVRRILFKNNIIEKKKITNMKLHIGTNDYLIVVLRKNNIPKTKTVHRLVATHFINNPENHPQVNHKDGNKHNNNINNLEWCSVSENLIHAYKNGLRVGSAKGKYGGINPKAIKVCMYDKNGNFLKEFNSLIEAAHNVNMKQSSPIVRCCKGELKTAKGYIWRYAK